MRSSVLKWAAPIALFCLATAWAESKPDFSGTWKPDMAKSDFGPMPGSEAPLKVEHKDPNLTVWMKVQGMDGEQEIVTKNRTDGVETENSFGPMTFKSKGNWDGSKLVIESKGDMGGQEMKFKEVWTLGAEGKTLTIERTMSGPMGEATQKVVCNKQ